MREPSCNTSRSYGRRQGGLLRVLADLVIPELLMAAITVGFVGAVLALAQVIVLALVTLEG